MKRKGETESSGCGFTSDTCPIANRVSLVEQDLNDLRKQNNSTHERLFDRIGELEKNEGIQGEQFKHIIEKLGDLTTVIADVKTDSKNIVSQITPIANKLDNIDTLEKQVEEIRMKPAKKWDGVVEKVVMMIVAAVVAFMLGRLGLQ